MRYVIALILIVILWFVKGLHGEVRDAGDALDELNKSNQEAQELLEEWDNKVGK